MVRSKDRDTIDLKDIPSEVHQNGKNNKYKGRKEEK